MPRRLSDEENLKNVELVQKMVVQFPEERRKKVHQMLEGPVGTAYYTAPASSREEFHSCYPGGLVQHSLNVVSNLYKLTKSLCPDRYNKATLMFVGLFHDLGKAGDGENEAYVPNSSEYYRSKGNLYETNRDCVFMPTSERSLYVLQKHGIELTAEEFLAIRLNDGMHDETNRRYSMKEPDLALLLHWADMWSVKQEKL